MEITSIVKEYNPLDYENLVRSCIFELMSQTPVPLPISKPFPGAGIYALYYQGDFPLYNSVSSLSYEIPIYVGKAVWEGTRKGVKLQKIVKGDLRAQVGGPIYRRLREHQASIQAATNLNISDFRARYLAVHHVWITQLETLLINKYEPLWNQCIEGFGLHHVGHTRQDQKVSWWDTLHPGRSWADKMLNRRTTDEVYSKVSEFRTLIANHPDISTMEERAMTYQEANLDLQDPLFEEHQEYI